MTGSIIRSSGGVTLAGGGALPAALLARALAVAPRLVAADGGLDRALRLGHMPEAVIGDLDSASPEALAQVAPGRLHRVAEQETTDFDKALRSIDAPFVVAVGVSGPRLDHMLAVFNTLARHAHRRCIVLGERDLCFVAPPEMSVSLPAGCRVSLFPMGPVSGTSSGLQWPIDGLSFAPGGMVGTSNHAVGGPVSLRFDAGARMLVILPPETLDAALAALAPQAARGE